MNDKTSDPSVLNTRREQRATVRVHFRVRVMLTARDGNRAVGDVVEGQVVNLSTGGMFVQADRKLPVGSPCVVMFSLQDNGNVRELSIPSRVAHGQGDGMGIQFVEMSGVARALVSRQVNRILYGRD